MKRSKFTEEQGRLRDECLNVHQFASLAEAQIIIEAWRRDYNQRRPHSSLGHLTPEEFAQQRQVSMCTEEVPALVKSCLGMGPTSQEEVEYLLMRTMWNDPLARSRPVVCFSETLSGQANFCAGEPIYFQ